MCWPQSATKIHVLAMQTVLITKESNLIISYVIPSL